MSGVLYFIHLGVMKMIFCYSYPVILFRITGGPRGYNSVRLGTCNTSVMLSIIIVFSSARIIYYSNQQAPYAKSRKIFFALTS